MAQLVRQSTIKFAKMLPKASAFNDIINLRKEQWDLFISKLNEDIIGAALNPFNPFCNIIDKCEGIKYKIEANGSQTITVSNNFPKVFLLGGNAYSAYGKYFANLGYNLMENNAPRTHDYDIVISLNQEITEHIIKLVSEDLIKFINKYIDTVIDPSYLEHFEEIKQKEEKEEEKVIYMHPTKKIELTILQGKKYVNFRLNMALNIGGIYEKNHLIEFVLWSNTSHFYKGITKINYLSTNNGLNYAVPIVSDLVLLTLSAIINRSLKPGIIAKCRQDFARLKYLCETLGNKLLASFNIGNICKIAEDIIYRIPQCYEDLSDEQFKYIQQKMLQLDEQKRLIEKKKNIEKDLRQNLNESQNILLNNNKSSYETKYLKYKQKYLILKKLSQRK